MGTRIHGIGALGQSIWCDSISRSLIDSGQLARLIDDGVVGMTSNPTIFEKAISRSDDYDEAIQSLTGDGLDAIQVYEALAVTDVGDAADLLRPIHDRTRGLDGYVSIEVDPHLANDTDGTVVEARRLHKRLNRPNILIKVPATEAGMPAVESLIAEGINVNVTLIFSLSMYAKVMEAYIRGVERLASNGGDVTRAASVASFFVSRVDTAVDKQLQSKIDAGASDLTPLLGQAAIGNAKLAYKQYKSIFHGERFAKLATLGAPVQRPLWASTSAKNPAYPVTYYVDTLIGPETVNTLPLETIEAAKNHATCESTIEKDVQGCAEAMERIEGAGISMERITSDLLDAGVKAFADSFDQLLGGLRAKIAQLQTAGS